MKNEIQFHFMENLYTNQREKQHNQKHRHPRVEYKRATKNGLIIIIFIEFFSRKISMKNKLWINLMEWPRTLSHASQIHVHLQCVISADKNGSIQRMHI